MNIRGWRGGEQRASLQTLSGLEENLGLGLEQHLWGWVLLTAAKGTGQRVLVCHPWLQVLNVSPEHPWCREFGFCCDSRVLRKSKTD